MTESGNNYKDTLNLPKTSFDMKANLLQKEPAMVKAWQEQNLYCQIRKARAGAPKGKWVLHDGPPYANGDIHMGHLINKVLKDIVVKFRTMQGLDSPYVPGWDCHGLPIESAIQKELGPKFRELDKAAVRAKCHDYAMGFVKKQGEGFKRLGVLADYEHPYLTLDPKYEAGILEVLAQLVKSDLVYRQKKPVHWCVNDRTALAEAELEYAKKKDSSIYVMFELADLGLGQKLGNVMDAAGEAFAKEFNIPNDDLKVDAEPHYLMIWTTTPWTIPANRAVAVHPDYEYTTVTFTQNDKVRNVMVAKELVAKVMAAAGITEYSVSEETITGAEWVSLNPKYKHPLDPSRLQPVVTADYVTLEDGTGLVHTAPGHGKEDYMTGLKYGLEIYNPVLGDGRYDDTVPEFLRADPKTNIFAANELVVNKLKELGSLFHHQLFDHDYPHCWRCKKPVIFRATEQWFVKASGEGEDGKKVASPLWQNAVNWLTPAEGDNAKPLVEFYPAWGRNRFLGMLQTRPDWCISRQRSWGVPIPAFFDPQGKTLITEKSVRKVAEYFRAHGASSWYTDSCEQILGSDPVALGFPAGTDLSKLEKAQDILDVWFESGASHHAVLECTHPELGYPAAMYLEGSDQHRGWFHSTLLEAAGYKAVPPYKQILTHGFIVDAKGRKMSKSEGNDIKVADALKEFGADILRLWVCSVDYQNDIPCSKELFKTLGESYRKIRNTIRYLLGNLYDFNPAVDSAQPGAHSIDTWMQARLDAVAAEAYAAYDNYEFHKVFKLIYEFCNVDVSATYAKAIKDRMYCELPNSSKRRASQTVCYHALVAIIELMAPVLVFTAEEAWAAVRKLPGCDTLEPSVHMHTIKQHSLNKTPALTAAIAHWDVLMPLVEKGNKQLDDLKRSVGLGNPLDAEAVIVLPKNEDDISKLIAQYGPEIEDALGVGFHRTEHGDIWDIKINDTREKYPSCARSWKRRPDVGSVPAYPDLSKRDAEVVAVLKK